MFSRKVVKYSLFTEILCTIHTMLLTALELHCDDTMQFNWVSDLCKFNKVNY